MLVLMLIIDGLYPFYLNQFAILNPDHFVGSHVVDVKKSTLRHLKIGACKISFKRIFIPTFAYVCHVDKYTVL